MYKILNEIQEFLPQPVTGALILIELESKEPIHVINHLQNLLPKTSQFEVCLPVTLNLAVSVPSTFIVVNSTHTTPSASFFVLAKAYALLNRKTIFVLIKNHRNFYLNQLHTGNIDDHYIWR